MLCDSGWVGALHNVQKRLWEISKDPHRILHHIQLSVGTAVCVDANDSKLW